MSIQFPAIQLVAINGELHYPPNPNRKYRPKDNVGLLRIYPEGDCDCIKWPNPNQQNLERTLFDDREMGWIGINQDVLLPNGKSAFECKAVGV